jgi:hypothetical protein
MNDRPETMSVSGWLEKTEFEQETMKPGEMQGMIQKRPSHG